MKKIIQRSLDSIVLLGKEKQLQRTWGLLIQRHAPCFKIPSLSWGRGPHLPKEEASVVQFATVPTTLYCYLSFYCDTNLLACLLSKTFTFFFYFMFYVCTYQGTACHGEHAETGGQLSWIGSFIMP